MPKKHRIHALLRPTQRAALACAHTKAECSYCVSDAPAVRHSTHRTFLRLVQENNHPHASGPHRTSAYQVCTPSRAVLHVRDDLRHRIRHLERDMCALGARRYYAVRRVQQRLFCKYAQ